MEVDLPFTMTTLSSIDSNSFFQVNDVVEVMARMWPGINKQGGVAKILSVHYSEDDDEYFYDVKYIVNNGRELKVEEKYIKLYETETGPRSTQGRCRLCGSFVKDCGHDEVTIQKMLLEQQKQKDAVAVTKRKHDHDENNPSSKVKTRKKQKIIKPNLMSYDESVQFIVSNTKQPHNTSHLKTVLSSITTEADESYFEKEFYGDTFIDSDHQMDDWEGDSDGNAEYDSDYTEDVIHLENNSIVAVSPINVKLQEETTIGTEFHVIDLTVMQVDTSNSKEKAERNPPFVIEITNDSKEKAKLFHKVFFDNCLYITASEKLIYDAKVQEIKRILDINMLWTLLNLCFNFVINLSQRIRQLIKDRDDFRAELFNDRKDRAEKSADVEDRMVQCAQKIIAIAENQQTLFEKIEKAGIDIFNQCVIRFRKLLKMMQQPPSSVKIMNKKLIQQKLEQLILQVNSTSIEMSDCLKDGRKAINQLYSCFETYWNCTVEEALSEKQEEEEEETYLTDGSESPPSLLQTKTNFVNLEGTHKKPRIHNISAEAGSAPRRERNFIFEEETRVKANIQMRSSFESNEEVENEQGIRGNAILTTSNAAPRTTVKGHGKDPSISDFHQRVKKVEQKKKISNINEIFDFIDSEDELELLTLKKAVFQKTPRYTGEVPTYYPSRRVKERSENSSKVGETIHVDGKFYAEDVYSTRWSNPQLSFGYDIVRYDEQHPPSSSRFSRFYQMVVPIKDPLAVYDGRVTVLWDAQSLLVPQRSQYEVVFNYSFPKGNEYSNRLTDALLRSTIPSCHFLTSYQNSSNHLPTIHAATQEQSKSGEIQSSNTTLDQNISNERNDETERINESLKSLLSSLHDLVTLNPFRSTDPHMTTISDPFDFLCQIWDAMTTSSPPSFENDPQPILLMNETILFMTFSEQWKIFLDYFYSFLQVKWNCLIYESRGSNTSATAFAKREEFIQKIIHIILSPQFFKFFNLKQQQTEKLMMMSTGEITQLTSSTQSSTQAAALNSHSELAGCYMRTVMHLLHKIKQLFFPLFNSNNTERLLNALFLSSSDETVDGENLSTMFLQFQMMNYQWLHSQLQDLLRTIRTIESADSNSVIINPSEKMKEIFSQFEHLLTSYYMNPVTEILQFFLHQPSCCLFFSYQLHQLLQVPTSPSPPANSSADKENERNRDSSSPHRLFIRWFYLLLSQIENLSKEFQSTFPAILQKKVKEYENLSLMMSMKYLSLKYFDRMNYHLQQAITLPFQPFSPSSPSSSFYEEGIRGGGGRQGFISREPRGMKRYQLNSFLFLNDTSNDSSELQLHYQSFSSRNLEVMWMLLVVLSNAQFGILSSQQQQPLSGVSSFVVVPPVFRIPSNWSLLKSLFHQFISYFIDSSKLNAVSLISAILTKEEGKREFDSRLHSWLMFQERFVKFALFWDQGISTGLDTYLQMMLKSLPIFDFLSSSIAPPLFIAKERGKKGLQSSSVFDVKLLLLLSHLSYNHHHDSKSKNAVTASSVSAIMARQELQRQLLLILHLLFESNDLIHPHYHLFSTNNTHENNAHAERQLTTASILPRLAANFKDLLVNSILSLSPAPSSSLSLSSSSLVLDAMMYRKLKSEIKKHKKKFYEIFQKKPCYVTGLLLLGMMKELFHLFGAQTMIEEYQFYEECQRLIMESSFEVSAADQQSLLSNDTSTSTSSVANNLQQLATDNNEEVLLRSSLVEKQRSLLLLFNAIIVFNPLPIYTELKFNNHDPSTSAATNAAATAAAAVPSILITEDEFLLVLKKANESHEKNCQSLSPFLTIFEMVRSIRSQAFLAQDERGLKNMLSIHYACLSTAAAILSNWNSTTMSHHHYQSSASEESHSPLEPAQSDIFRVDFTIPRVPEILISQLLTSITVSVQQLSAQGTSSSSKATTIISNLQQSEFSTYILLLKLIVEMTLSYQRQLRIKLSSFLRNSQTSLQIRNNLTTVMQSAVLFCHQTVSSIAMIVFHQNIQKIYHYLVKKCFIYSNSLSFALPSLLLPEKEKEEKEEFSMETIRQYHQHHHQQQSRNYYRKMQSYASLRQYSELLANLLLIAAELRSLLQEIVLFTDPATTQRKNSECTQTIDQIWKLYESSPSSLISYGEGGVAAQRKGGTGGVLIQQSQQAQGIDNTAYFTYEIQKYFFYSTILRMLASKNHRSSGNSTVERTQSDPSLLYMARMICPQFRNIYQNVLVIASILESKPLLAEECSLPETMNNLQSLVGLLAGDILGNRAADSLFYGNVILNFAESLSLHHRSQSPSQFIFLRLIRSFLSQVLDPSSSSSLFSSTPEVTIGSFFEQCSELIFRTLRYLQLCQFHTNDPSSSTDMIRLISSYFFLYGALLAQHIKPNTDSSSTNIATAMAGKRLLPLSHITFFYQEFIQPFTTEFLTILVTIILNNDRFSNNRNNANHNAASLKVMGKVYLQLLYIILRSVCYLPYSTRLKEWEVIFYPFLSLLLLNEEDGDAATTMTTSSISEHHQAVNHFRVKVFLHILLNLSFLLWQQEEQEREKEKRGNKSEGTFDTRFRQVAEDYLSSVHSTRNELIDESLQEYASHCKQFSEYQRQFFENDHNNAEGFFVKEEGNTVHQQQRRDFLQYFLYAFQFQSHSFVNMIQATIISSFSSEQNDEGRGPSVAAPSRKNNHSSSTNRMTAVASAFSSRTDESSALSAIQLLKLQLQEYVPKLLP